MFSITSEKRVKTNMKIALFMVLFLSPFSAAARIIINLNYVEETTGYAITAIPTVHFAIAVIVALLAPIASRLFELSYRNSFDPTCGDYTPTNISPYSNLIFNKTSAVVVFMSAFLGFAMITSFFLMVFNLFNRHVGVLNKFVLVLLILFMALAGMFFIVSATKNPSPHRKYYACLSFTPVLWSAMRIIMCFMDTSRYINTTSRHLELLNVIAITLFFLYQSRFTLQDYRYHKMGMFFAFGLSSIILISSSSIPSLISVAFFPYTAQISNENDIIFWLLDIITLFYITARLFRAMTLADTISQDDLKDYARGYTKAILKSTKK